MASPTPKPTSPFSKPAKATKKAASPFLKPGQKAPQADPWKPVLSFGQSVIDTLSTPLYGVEGTLNALFKGKNPIEAAQAGAENATAWTRGKRPITGSELLKTAGIESNFWTSLAADVLLDPLTYTPGVVFTAPLKAAGVAGKTAIKAGTLAAKGEIAATKGATGTKQLLTKYATKTDVLGVGKAPTITPATDAQKTFLAKYLKKYDASKANIDKYTYSTITAPTTRSSGQAVNDVLASAFTAGKQAMVGTLLSEGAKNTLRKYARKEASLIKKSKNDLPAAEVAKGAVIQAPKVPKAPKVVETVAPKVTPKTIAEQIKLPVLADTAPKIQEIRNVAKAAPKTADVKNIQKILDGVDRAAKQAKVSTIAQVDNLAKVKEILNPARDARVAAVSNIDKNIFARVKDAITRKDGASPFSFYRYFSESVAPEQADIAKQVGGIKLIDTNGNTATLAQIARNYKKDAEIPADLMQQAAKIFEDTFIKLGTADGLEKIRYDELSRLLGAETADQFKVTGALNPAKKTNEDALKSLLLGLPEAGTVTKKTYKSFDDLIHGLQQGDVVNTDSLLKVIRALDPEGKLDAKVEKAMAGDAFTGLKNILVTNVRTVLEARDAIAKATPETMFKAKNFSYADAAAAYFNGRVAGEIEALPDAIRNSRQANAETIANLDQGSVMNAATGLSRGIDYLFNYFTKYGKYEQVTSRGDAVARSTSGRMTEESKAIRYLEPGNENTQAVVGAVFAGRGTYREGKKLAKAQDTGVPFVPSNRLDDFAAQMNIADKILHVTTGSHFIVKAQAKATAKGAAAHQVFLHLGDVADVAMKFKGTFEDAVRKAFFPETGNKYDGISFVGLMDAIRMTLEGVEKNAAVTSDMLISRLTSVTGAQSNKWSEQFKTMLPGIADEIATGLLRKDVQKAFTDIHTGRLLGDIEDAIQPAVTMTAEIFDLMHNAWKVNNDLGINSPAARMDVVRQFFNEFAYTAHIFDQNYGPAGETVFKAAAMMFVKDGKVGEARLIPTDAEEFMKFRESMNEYFKHTNSELVAPAGREHLPFPTDKTKSDMQVELQDAMNNYEAHMNLIPTLRTKADVKAWGAQRIKLQRALDAIRPKAWAAWQQTYHWVGGEKRWIPTEEYQHAKELKAATENRIIITTEGPVNLGEMVSDTKPPVLEPKLSKKQEQAAIKARDAAATKRGEQLAAGAKIDAADHVLSKEQEFKQMFPDDEMAQASRKVDEKFNKPIEDSNIPVIFTRNRWENVQQGALGRVGTLRQLGEKLSATFGKAQTMHIAAQNESIMQRAIQNVAKGAALIRDRYAGTLEPDMVARGFSYAIHGTTIPANSDPLFVGLVQDLSQLLHPIKEELKNTTIPNDILDRAFAHFGISRDRGFKMAKDTKDKSKMLHDLPFMEMPEKIADNTELAREFNTRAEAFKAKGLDPFIMLANYASAIQHAKTEVAIGRQFAVEFSHVAEGLTRAEALAKGYVTVKGVGGGIDLTLSIPKDALFHPYFAEQFGAMNRHWNAVYEKGMPVILRTILDITGMFKATQTLLRPGHHMTNIIGDTTVAIMRGARNPGDWSRAIKLAFQHASEDVKSNMGKAQFKTTMDQITRSLEGVGGRKYVPGEEDGLLTVAIGGKKMSFSNEELTKMFEDNGVLINNIFYDQYQGLYEATVDLAKTTSTPETELRKQLAVNLKDATNKMSAGFQKVIKPFGDFASYYGNAPRLATALDVMQKGSFKSVDEMLAAVNDVVNRYHPTIQSLSGWERKYPRAIFTYYTWLRVAHNALIDLAMNHTSAMTFYSKAQYNKAEEANLQPISIGQPWGSKTDTPNYINYSVYGPTYTGPRGAMMMKPAILPLDVIDTYNFSYDPAYTADQNAVRNIGQLTQGVLGKNVNLLAQLPIEMITKTSPATGKPSQVKDLQTLMDRMFSMTGFYTLAKGTGLYTPPNKAEGTANPLTQRDRDLQLQNWLLGLKQSDVYTPSNIQNAQSEQSARQNAFLKNFYNK